MIGRLDELQSASSRPLRLRMRPDLVAHQQIIGNQRRWLIRDPLTLAHFQLAEEEFALLQLLDGKSSVDELRAAFEHAFAPKRLSVSRLLAWAGKLHRDGLLMADVPGQAERLLEQGQTQRQNEVASRLMNILAIRFRGLDPDRFLEWLHQRVRWLFSPWFVTSGAFFGLSALVWTVVHLDAAFASLPELSQMFYGTNLVCLLMVLAGTKIVHELAHGLACKHHGGECHELGVLLLVFTPCLYCDVSDAWSLRSRWKRIAISAAGMYAELLLASLAAVVWWFSRPGLLNLICLDVMLVCGVSTLIFNGNPLLRYDGYFVLADLVNVPNLASRSRSLLVTTISSWFVDNRRHEVELLDDGHRNWLLLYAVAAACYRWCLIVTILLFLLTALEPYGLGVVGQIVTCFVLVGMIVVPANRTLRRMSRPTAPPIRRRRVVGAVAGLILVAICFCYVPLPCRVTAPVLLQPHDPQHVYVSMPGTIMDALSVGDRVVVGQAIATLDDAEFQRELAELSGEFAERTARLASLEAMRLDNPAVSSRIPEEQEMLANVKERLAERCLEARRLQLLAERDGVVMAPVSVAGDQPDQRELATWSGTPLDASNRGAFLESGTLVCVVGEPHAFDAIAYVDASVIPFIEPGQQASVLIANQTQTALDCMVETIAKADLASVPREMSRLIDVEPSTGDDAPIEARNTVYQVRLRLAATDVPLVNRMTGRARIQVAPQSLGRRAARQLHRTFVFMLGR